MATYNGREASVKIGTYTVAELGTWSLSMTADEIDTTAFGSTWAKSDVGFKKWSITFSGFWDPTDTNGQKVIEDAFQSGNLIDDIKLYIDNTSYWVPDTTTDSNAGGRVTNYSVGQSKAGVATIDITISGSGPITFV